MESWSDRAYKNKIKEIQNLVSNKASSELVQKAQMELEAIGKGDTITGLPKSKSNLRTMVLGVKK